MIYGLIPRKKGIDAYSATRHALPRRPRTRLCLSVCARGVALRVPITLLSLAISRYCCSHTEEHGSFENEAVGIGGLRESIEQLCDGGAQQHELDSLPMCLCVVDETSPDVAS